MGSYRKKKKFKLVKYHGNRKNKGSVLMFTSHIDADVWELIFPISHTDTLINIC